MSSNSTVTGWLSDPYSIAVCIEGMLLSVLFLGLMIACVVLLIFDLISPRLKERREKMALASSENSSSSRGNIQSHGSSQKLRADGNRSEGRSSSSSTTSAQTKKIPNGRRSHKKKRKLFNLRFFSIILVFIASFSKKDNFVQ